MNNHIGAVRRAPNTKPHKSLQLRERRVELQSPNTCCSGDNILVGVAMRPMNAHNSKPVPVLVQQNSLETISASSLMAFVAFRNGRLYLYLSNLSLRTVSVAFLYEIATGFRS